MLLTHCTRSEEREGQQRESERDEMKTNHEDAWRVQGIQPKANTGCQCMIMYVVIQ